MKGQNVEQAVILAGGYGTRLYPLTQTRHKSLLPIVGTPLIHRIVRYLEHNGFNKVVVTLNNFSDQIKESFEGFHCNADIIFSEENAPLGTAGSVKKARRHINGTFLVIQGDSLTNIELSGPQQFHLDQGAIATILLKERKEVTGFGVVDIDSGANVSRFVEKPPLSDGPPRLVNTGIYFLDSRVLDQIPENTPYDFAKHLFPSLLSNKLKLKGFPVEGYWIDIGSPKTYREADRWFLRLLTERFVALETGQLGESVPPRVFTRIGSDEGLGELTIVGTSLINQACHIDKRAIIEGSILERGVTVGSGAVIRDSIIMEGARIEAGSAIDSAIIGENCHIGSGSGINEGSVLGGYVEVRPTATIKENSLIAAMSVVYPVPSEATAPSGEGPLQTGAQSV